MDDKQLKMNFITDIYFLREFNVSYCIILYYCEFRTKAYNVTCTRSLRMRAKLRKIIILKNNITMIIFFARKEHFSKVYVTGV